MYLSNAIGDTHKSLNYNIKNVMFTDITLLYDKLMKLRK